MLGIIKNRGDRLLFILDRFVFFSIDHNPAIRLTGRDSLPQLFIDARVLLVGLENTHVLTDKFYSSVSCMGDQSLIDIGDDAVFIGNADHLIRLFDSLS